MSSSRLPINEDTIRSLQAQLSLLEHSLGKPEAIPAQDMSQTLPAPMSRHNFAPLSRLDELTSKLKEKLDQIEQPSLRQAQTNREAKKEFLDTTDYRLNYTFPSQLAQQRPFDFDDNYYKEEDSCEMNDKLAAIEGMKALERIESRKKRNEIQRQMDETRKELDYLKMQEQRLEIEQLQALSMKGQSYKEMNSVNVEVGSPDNNVDENSDSEQPTYTICREDENQLAERISSLERVMVKVLAETDDNKNQIAELKNTLLGKKTVAQNTQPANKLYSSTPHQKAKSNISQTARETLQRVEKLFRSQPESTAFFASTFALLSVAKTPNIQNKIKQVIQAEVEGTGSEIEVSDGEISELDRAGRLADLYQKKLPELVENLLNPLLFHLVNKNDSLSHADIKTFVDKFSLNAGVLSLPSRQRDSFKGELLLYLSTFVGNKKIERDAIVTDLTKILVTLIEKIRIDKQMDAHGDKEDNPTKSNPKIQLTEAELQTSYGSGEDDSSDDFDEVEIIEKVAASAVTEIGDDN